MHRSGEGGGRRLVAAGVLFILPAALMVLALAWAYVEYGETQELRWALYGVQPVVIAVVVQAIWGLAQALSDAACSVGVGALRSTCSESMNWP
ncbi:MAG: chromate transporter [Chloroflexia bacterium]